MPYRKIKITELLPADVIVTTTQFSSESAVIRAGTRGSVSHAILYTGDNTVIEAVFPKVRLTNYDTATSQATLAIALRRRSINAEQRSNVVNCALTLVGKPYDIPGAITSGTYTKSGMLIALAGIILFPQPLVDRLKNDTLEQISLSAAEADQDSAFFCSELVSRVFTMAGVPIVYGRATDQTPRNIRYAPELNYLGHLIDKKVPADDESYPSWQKAKIG